MSVKRSRDRSNTLEWGRSLSSKTWPQYWNNTYWMLGGKSYPSANWCSATTPTKTRASDSQPRNSLRSSSTKTQRQEFQKLHPYTELEAYESLLEDECEDFPDISVVYHERWKYGGLPVWQGRKFEDLRKPGPGSPSHRLFAFTAISFSTLEAERCSWLV